MSGTDELDVGEEYKLWRQNCKFMYEYVSETVLTWPSLTVQWLPEHTVDDMINAKLLLGTHTSGSEQEYLKVASTKLPKSGASADSGAGTGVSELPDTKPKASSIIKISKKLPVASEINRARYMPQDANIVAALLDSGVVEVFDLSSGASTLSFDTQTESGYCLSWSAHEKGRLITALANSTIAVRDVFRTGDDAVLGSTDPHAAGVNDVSWHCFDASVFAAVTEDDRMMLYDARAAGGAVLSFHSQRGSSERSGINALAFSPFSRNLVALGGANSNISLVDLRMLSKNSGAQGLLHTMMGHGDGISCMGFSTHVDGVLATGSQDRRVIIWDLSKIGEEQSQEDAEDGSPEIFMMHAGHTGAITDFSWCPFAKWTLATLADDNIVHIWKVSQAIINSEKKLDENFVLE
ncbi:WD40 repeat-like protein [Metschnikowia bicuspidata]|uniref:WD40 repeat-like protein n=1 Tax=Metschnikowia bicuspidata TaxID=27322 RepID=A0A4P9ZFV6_9ASCO|nr:WD40 repeat-like protein [Metschnikowia bicuspidata]